MSSLRRRLLVVAGGLWLVALPGGLGACVGGAPEGLAAREALAAYVLDAPPPDIGHRLDIDFDGKVTLLGAKVEPGGPVRPGQTVKVTLYWRATARVGAGWNLFTHVLDGAGERIGNQDNVGPLRAWQGDRQVLGPWAWEPGKVYVDEQQITLPSPIRSARVDLVTGLWKGADRMPVKAGPHDRHHRGVFATLTVGTGSVSNDGVVLDTRVPRLRADRMPSLARLTIDGKLDEPEWQRAGFTGQFRDVATGQPNRREDLGGNARVLWDAAALYIGFTVSDRDVVGGFPAGAKDPHLWTRDTVEIMVDPDGDGDNRDYYEIQINPQNLVFDSRFDTYNLPRPTPDGPFGHQDFSAGVESAVTIDGTLDASQDRDRGYVVEARIPWTAFDRAAHAPPRIGDEWRMNFYAMQAQDGVAWSPILRQGNFHKASRFGRVVFAEPGWLPPGAKSASPVDSAAPPRSAGTRSPLRLAPQAGARPD